MLTRILKAVKNYWFQDPYQKLEPLPIFYVINAPEESDKLSTDFKDLFNVTYTTGKIPLKYPILIADVHKLTNTQSRLGVYALKSIPANQYVAELTGMVVPTSILTFENSYTFSINDQSIDTNDAGNFTRFINHSDLPNCVFTEIKLGPTVMVALKTLREITAQEQLLVNYGYRYWQTLPRLFLNPYDSWLTPHERYGADLNKYQPLLSVLAHDQFSALMSLVPGRYNKLIPRFDHANLPILYFENGYILPQQSGITLFHLNCFLGNIGDLMFQLEDKIDFNLQCNEGRNALHYTVLGHGRDTLKSCILRIFIHYAQEKNFSIITMPDKYHKTVYHYCIEKNLFLSLGILLQFVKMNFDFFVGPVESPLITAIKCGNAPVLDMILKHTDHNELIHHINQPIITQSIYRALQVTSSEDLRKRLSANLIPLISPASAAMACKRKPPEFHAGLNFFAVKAIPPSAAALRRDEKMTKLLKFEGKLKI